jgi:hypothetical protein
MSLEVVTPQWHGGLLRAECARLDAGMLDNLRLWKTRAAYAEICSASRIGLSIA